MKRQESYVDQKAMRFSKKAEIRELWSPLASMAFSAALLSIEAW